jgi:hypothetical protein
MVPGFAGINPGAAGMLKQGRQLTGLPLQGRERGKLKKYFATKRGQFRTMIYSSTRAGAVEVACSYFGVLSHQIEIEIASNL